MRASGWRRWMGRGVVAALAQSLPRLPQDFTFPRGQGSPGTVTFTHRTHVDPRQPDCTACHPGLFKILEKGIPAEGGPVGHASLPAGRQCWACHNGKNAFGPANCLACHRPG